MAAPTLADFKQHLNDTGDENDTELQSVLDAAVELVGLMVGPLEPAEVTETHYGLSTGLLVLRKAPVVEVASINTTLDPPYTVPADQYAVEGPQGVVRYLMGRLVGDYVVTYTAGWETLPAPIHLATLIIGAHLWETQRVPGARRQAFGQQTDQQPPVGRGYAVPYRAATLLAPYMLPVVA